MNDPGLLTPSLIALHDAIPWGRCCRCGLLQETKASGGFFINGNKNVWACSDCKYGKNGPEIRSYPMACEWCAEGEKIKWHQGGTYTCEVCERLKIGQAAPLKSQANK